MLFKLISFAGLTALLFTAHLRADDSAESQKSLVGVKTVLVAVSDIDSNLEMAGLIKQDIRTAIELRLRREGIKLLGDGPIGLLEVQVDTAKLDDDGRMIVYTLDVSFLRSVCLEDDKSICFLAETWSTGRWGVIRIESIRRIRDSIEDLVAKFANAFLKMNP